jgi:hypothetical protein
MNYSLSAHLSKREDNGYYFFALFVNHDWKSNVLRASQSKQMTNDKQPTGIGPVQDIALTRHK